MLIYAILIVIYCVLFHIIVPQFLGQTSKLIERHFPWIHIVRGRAHHLQSRGICERSHGPYKKALLKWLVENNTTDWTLGAYIVSGQMKQHPSRVRGSMSAYYLVYGRNASTTAMTVLGAAASIAQTEYGIALAQKL